MLFPPCRLVPAGALCAIVCALHPAAAAKVLLWNLALEPISILDQHGQAIHDSPADSWTAIAIEPPEGEPLPWELQVVAATGDRQRTCRLAYTTIRKEDRVVPCLSARSPGAWLSPLVPAGPGAEPAYDFQGFPEALAAGAGAESAGHPAMAGAPPSPSHPLPAGTLGPEGYAEALLMAPRVKAEPGIKPEPGPTAEEDAFQRGFSEQQEREHAMVRLLAMLATNPSLLGRERDLLPPPHLLSRIATTAERARTALEVLTLKTAQELLEEGATVATMVNTQKARVLQRRFTAQLQALEHSGQGNSTEAGTLRAALGNPPAPQALPSVAKNNTSSKRAAILRKKGSRTAGEQAELERLQAKVVDRKAGFRRHLDLARRVAGNPESLTPQQRNLLQKRHRELSGVNGRRPRAPVEPTEGQEIADVLEGYNRAALRLAREFRTHPQGLEPHQRQVINTRLRVLRGTQVPSEMAEREEMAAVLGPVVSVALQLARDLQANPARVPAPGEEKVLKARVREIRNGSPSAARTEEAEIAGVIDRVCPRGQKRKAPDEAPEPPPQAPSVRVAVQGQMPEVDED